MHSYRILILVISSICHTSVEYLSKNCPMHKSYPALRFKLVQVQIDTNAEPCTDMLLFQTSPRIIDCLYSMTCLSSRMRAQIGIVFKLRKPTSPTFRPWL